MISIGQKVHPKSVIFWTRYIPYLSLRDTWGLLNSSEIHVPSSSENVTCPVSSRKMFNP